MINKTKLNFTERFIERFGGFNILMLIIAIMSISYFGVKSLDTVDIVNIIPLFVAIGILGGVVTAAVAAALKK